MNVYVNCLKIIVFFLKNKNLLSFFLFFEKKCELCGVILNK